MTTITTSTPTNPELSQYRVSGEIPIPLLIGWLTLVACPILLLFSWRALRQGMTMPAYALALFAALLAINGVIYLLGRNTRLQRRGFITLITLLFTYLAVNAVEDGSAILWLFAYPPIIFYISESRGGVIACAGGFVGTALLFSPAGTFFFDVPYTTSFKITMLAVLAFEMATCFVLDQSRRRSKLGLLKLAADFEYAATHDALTGLANRREAHQQLTHEYERYLRHDRAFSVLLMDIDLFKSINDNHGHHVGDAAIVMVAKTVQDQCRKVDVVSRWGGEEFLLLLPETDSEESLRTAERIRAKIASTAIEAEGQRIYTSVSIGVATIKGVESIDRLLQRADEALYRAKTHGRNLVFEHQLPASHA